MIEALIREIKEFSLEGDDRTLIFKDEYDEMLDSLHFHNELDMDGFILEAEPFEHFDDTVTVIDYFYRQAIYEIEHANIRYAKQQGGVN